MHSSGCLWCAAKHNGLQHLSGVDGNQFNVQCVLLHLVPTCHKHMNQPVPALLQRDLRLLRKALKHSLAELATGDEERDCLRRRVEDLNKTLQVCWPMISRAAAAAW